jgi:hypothetical protein
MNRWAKQFCSHRCRGNAQRGRFTIVVTGTCIQCNQQFHGAPWRLKGRRFCSRRCHAQTLKGSNNSRFKERIEMPCANCGIAVPRYPYYARDRKRTFCTRACMRAWSIVNTPRGPAHPSYRNGHKSINATPEQLVMRRLHKRMSTGMWHALKLGTGKRRYSWLALVPYTIDQLRARLTRTMPSGYSWDDFLSGDLHIDHIVPQSAFNFRSPCDYDFQRCWSLSNLRLFPAAANISKGGRLAAPFQPSLL